MQHMIIFYVLLKKENIINYDLSYDVIYTDTHALILFAGETKNEKELIKYINEEIKNTNITEKELNRKKKTIVSSTIYMSDNIYGINNKIVNDIIKYNKIRYDIFDIVNSLNIEEYNEFMNSINFDNKNITVLNPK